MHRWLVALLLALVTLAPATASASEPLDAFVARQVRRLGHPGTSVGIVVGEEAVFAKGFGVRDKRRLDPVGTDTVFRIASITKTFTGVALLQLRDEGELSLDDTLVRWLPEAAKIRCEDCERTPILLRHIVTHTSGLQRKPPSGGTSEQDLLASLPWVRVEATPGTRTRYSNLAVGLLGPVIARAGGLSYREWMRTRVFEPLGMTHVAWEMRDVPRATLAMGHERVKEGERKGKLDPMKYEWVMGAAEAFGGMYVSLDDMTKYVSFELSAWDTTPERPEHAHVLARRSLRESQTVAFTGPPEPDRFGVAWHLEADDAYGLRVEHTGATDEYSACVSMIPSRDVGVVLLSNAADPGAVEAITHAILYEAAARLDRGEL